MSMHHRTRRASSPIGHWSLVIWTFNRRRTAFSLMEVLLVLAVIVMVAAISAPSLQRSWQRQRLKSAAEQIRSACTKAHITAMRSGQMQVLRFKIAGNEYEMTPWSAGDEDINASAELAPALDTLQIQAAPKLDIKKLPDDITFFDAAAEFDSRSSSFEQEAARSLLNNGTEWSQPILFYPDGTSSQAKITVVDKESKAITVSLKRLTGLTSIGELTSTDVMQSETGTESNQ